MYLMKLYLYKLNERLTKKLLIFIIGREILFMYSLLEIFSHVESV